MRFQLFLVLDVRAHTYQGSRTHTTKDLCRHDQGPGSAFELGSRHVPEKRTRCRPRQWRQAERLVGQQVPQCPSAALRHSSEFYSARAALDAHISASAEKSQFPFGLQALHSRQAGRRRGPFMGGCVDSSDSLRLKPTNN